MTQKEHFELFEKKFPFCAGRLKHEMFCRISQDVVYCKWCFCQMTGLEAKQLASDLVAEPIATYASLILPEKTFSDLARELKSGRSIPFVYGGTEPEYIKSCVCKSLLWGHENGCPMLDKKK